MVDSKGNEVKKEGKYWFVELADDQFKLLLDEGYSQEQVDEMKAIKKSTIDRLISDQLNLFYGEKRDPNHLHLMVMQEDVMGFLRQAAGFTLGEADSARRAMGKKKVEYLLPFKDKFMQAWDEKVGFLGEEVWEGVVDFAKYGFNRSHSMCYSVVSIQCLKMQTDYKKEYLTYQFFNAKTQERKDLAIKMLCGMGGIIFPTYRNPFDGFDISGTKFNSLDGDTGKSYMHFTDVFVDEDIDINIKAKMICRGVFDSITMNTKQLVEIWKSCAKKIHGKDNLPSSNNLNDFIENLKLMGIMETKYENGRMYFRKISPRSKKEIPWDYLRTTFDTMTAEEKNYRVTNQIKHIGMSNTNVYGSVKESNLNVYFNLLDSLKRKVENFISNNKDEYINSTNKRETKIYKVFSRYGYGVKVIDRIVDEGIYAKSVLENCRKNLMKGPNLDKFKRIYEMSECEIYGEITNKSTYSNSLKLMVSFANGTQPIYIYNSNPVYSDAIKNINKRDIVKFAVKIDYYISKKHEVVALYRYEPVL